jgi:hypothetical protein
MNIPFRNWCASVRKDGTRARVVRCPDRLARFVRTTASAAHGLHSLSMRSFQAFARDQIEQSIDSLWPHTSAIVLRSHSGRSGAQWSRARTH